MRYCDHCGKDIPGDAQFCRYCGVKVSQNAVEFYEQKEEQNYSSAGTGDVSETSNPVTDTPRPWIRFWARYIDISLFAFFSGLIIEPFYRFSPGPFLGFDFAGLVVMLTAVITLESICLTLFGSTPGKWIGNVHIADFSGSKPSILQSLSRTFQVWGKGMWFGIPILSLIPMYMAKGNLIRNGSTAWDFFCGTVVSQGPVSLIRYAGIIAAAVAIMLLNSYLNLDYDQQMKNPKLNGKSAIYHIWSNDSEWKAAS